MSAGTPQPPLTRHLVGVDADAHIRATRNHPEPRYRAVVVVGRDKAGRCGHCGSIDWIPVPLTGEFCTACFHWCAYWGTPPTEAKMWAEIASTFNGART